LQGPVFITERGRPSHVLLSIEQYRHLSGEHRSLIAALSMPGLADIESEPPVIDFRSRAADFS
jgi:PHD/YefM family antitoxin component YafN of YafNO toxin-antitoxin module